jgi:Putative abortive phage resistance protein AbiGi, antitoxin
LQRYISSELTHFVGRGLARDAQYTLLCKILSEGWISHPPHDPRVSSNLSIEEAGGLSTNDMYNPQMVCFCDIPVSDLEFHVRKYSPFGLAFSKPFLMGKGAAPVTYVPKSAAVKTLKETPDFENPTSEAMDSYLANPFEVVPRSRYFDASIRKLKELLSCPKLPEPPNGLGSDTLEFFSALRDWERQNRLQMDVDRWLNFNVFSYMKFFDAHISDDDPENYYFEREWRVLGNIDFTLSNVARVCMPQEYADRFAEHYPTYSGQRTFVEGA